MNALVPSDASGAMQLANMMSTGKLVPNHLQRSPGDCLMVIEQAMRWGMSPFAVAQCTSVIQGKLMFEGKLVAAALNSSGVLKGRLDYKFSGEGATRSITVIGTLKGESEPRDISVELKDAKTSNGMWTKQPDQQLVYFATRAWARRHAPEVMLGVYSPEEFDEQPKRDNFAGTTIEAKAEAAQIFYPARKTAAEEIGDSLPDHSAPHPLDEPNGTKWLKNLRDLLGACVTEDQVVEIAGHPTVEKALKSAPDGIKTMINDYLTDAYARFKTSEQEADAADPPTEADDFIARLRRMSPTEVERLDTDAAHRSFLKGLSKPDYDRVAAAITDRMLARATA